MGRNTIIVGYDGSPTARAAVEWAIDEARRFNSLVRLVEVVEWPVRVGPPTSRPETWPKTQAYRDAERALELTLAALSAANPDVPIAGLVVEGPPAVVLSDLSQGVRMVVVGDRGRGGFAGMLLGSVAAAVVTRASCPVAVIRRGAAGRPVSGPVVAGVDDSPGAGAVVAAAFEEAGARGAELAAVRAWQPPQAWHSLGRPRYDDAVDEMETAERKVLADVVADHRQANPSVTVSTHVPETPAARALVEASDTAQLVVVGSRGGSGFRGLRLDPTCRQLLRHAHCPVLVVRASQSA